MTEDGVEARLSMAHETISSPLTSVEAGPEERPALVVDLDGTLVKTDLLLESMVALLKQQPRYLFYLPFWLLKGKAYLKQEIARRVCLDAGALPYQHEFLQYLKAERAQGRTLVLATGGDMRNARQVADHLRLFNAILASDGATNLSGESKRDRLVAEFGAQGFDYAGNGGCDLAVWSSARKAIVVNAGQRLKSRVAPLAEVDRVFERPGRSLLEYIKPLRPQHWLKNFLVFVPLLAARQFYEIGLLANAALAFVAFSCCASGGYLINDLLDLAADRHHPHKRLRSFAAGALPLSYALAMIPVLMSLGLAVGALVSPLLAGILLVYLATTASYSLYARRIALLDVIVLAALYTLRILAGSAAVSIWASHWLLLFSTLVFFSLALVKRYGELVILRAIDGDAAKARGYQISDEELLAAMGIASGYLAVLVLALYFASGQSEFVNGRYEVQWLLCPLLLYWISHVWLMAHRGKLPDDPVVFASRDWTSSMLILLMLATTLAALW